MNVLCVLIVVAGIVIQETFGDSPASTAAPPNKLDRFLYDRCNRYNPDPKDYNVLKDRLGQFNDYFGYSIGLLPNGKKQFCNDETRQLLELMKSLTNDFKPCLPKEEKFLSKFIYDSFHEFLLFMCKKNGTNIDNFFSTQGKDCRDGLKQGNAGRDVQECFKKLFNRFNDMVNKEDLCYDLKSTQTCFGEALSRYCPNFLGFEVLNHNFFEAIRKPCTTPDSAVALGTQGIVLTIAAIVITKLFS